MKYPIFKLSTLAGIVISVLYQTAQAAVVRDDVDYQYFRDFAENKGQFAVGASDIPIIDKSGNNVGTMLANGIPMIDFSSADRNNAVAVALHPQYVVSVAHNGGYSSVSFGGQGNHPDAHHYNYQLVDRNNYPNKLNGLNGDYHLPRLHKLITEIVPSETTTAGLDNKTYLDRKRFPYFLRTGSGTQGIRTKQNKTQIISDAYQYLIGGTPVKINGSRHAWIDGGSNLFDSVYGPLVTYGLPGDSGSSVWAWDTTVNKWVHYGVLNFYRTIDDHHNTWTITRADWNKETIDSDNVNLTITTDNDKLTWKANTNSSTLTNAQGKKQLDLPIYDSTTKSLNSGKSLILDGTSGTLTLDGNVNQGAGALYFNSDFTVTGSKDNTTWQGAGVVVAKDKTVNWQVHNPNGDRLSKIGEGTLHIKGIGINQGDISVGDGTVILDQQPDNIMGARQAFRHVGIVSGRPTVVLNNASQVSPDNLYFGFRGGRLDVNGNDLSFNRIHHVDDGANIVNNNTTQAANITIKGNKEVTRRFLKSEDRVKPNQALYHWQAPNGRRDYFLPQKGKKFPYGYYPTNQQSNTDWEYLGSDFEKAAQIAIERANNSDERKITAFNGVLGEKSDQKHNGVLNVSFAPSLSNATLLLSGGLALNGTLTADNGEIILSGRPTPYAKIAATNTEVIKDDDWINRHFNANTISATSGGKIHIGRNVTAVNANFSAKDNASLNLGFVDNQTPICIRSDYTGDTHCQTQMPNQAIHNTIPITQITGNVHLADSSSLHLGKANLIGQIHANANSHMSMHNNSTWHMTADSTLGNLSLVQGSRIVLNANGIHTPQTLTINGQLSGNGRFDYLTDVSQLVGDKVIVNGKATGSHQLYVKDSGKEPTHANGLGLFVVNGITENLSVQLANAGEKVDLGALTYRLVRDGNTYYLHNPLSTQATANKGTAITADPLPKADIAIHGTGVKADALPEADIGIHGESVTAQALPKADISVHGAGVTAEQLPALAMNKNGAGVKADPLPKADIAIHGAGVTAQALPSADINVHGESVTAKALPNSDISIHGAGVTAEALDEFHVRILSVTHSLPDGVLDSSNKQTDSQSANTVAQNTQAQVAKPTKQQSITIAPTQANWISANSNTALSELSAQTHDVLRMGANLNRRISQAHTDTLKVWADVSQHSTRYASSNYQGYQQNSTVSEIGGQKSLGNDSYVGASFINTRSDNHFANAVTAHSKTNMLSAYAGRQWSNGVSASIDGSFGQAQHQLKDNNAQPKRDVWAVGVQVAKDMQMGLVVNVKPSAGVRYYQLSGVNYQLGETQIDTPSVKLASYHVGVDVGTQFDVQGVQIRPQLSSQYVNHQQNAMQVNVNNIPLTQKFSSHLRHEASVTAQKDALAVSAYAGMTSGDEADKQKYAGIKVGYRF